MIHITLALGVVIGGIFYSIILTLLLKSLSQKGFQASDLQMANQIAASAYILAIALAYFLLRKIALKERLPKKIPAFPLLVIGVWFTLLNVTIHSIPILKAFLAQLVSVFSSIAAFASLEEALDYLSGPISTAVSAFCIVALLIIFLECEPKKAVTEDK